MKKIRIGSVGLGRLGKTHAENILYRIPNAELKAVCSVVKSEVDEFQAKWGIEYVYTDFNEMLKNSELDAIFIASSSNVHCRHIEDALNAGFHVFSEKPLGVTIDEVLRVEKIVNSHKDRVFMLGFMRRFDPSYAYAKKLIEDGKIGDPFLIRCYGLDPVKAVQGAIAFAENSGGIFLDMAIHDLDLSRWYLNDEPETVFAVGGCFSYSEFAKYNDVDNAAALIQFKSGKIGMFYAGRTCAHGYHVETEIVGTKGSLRIGTVPEKNLTTVFDETGAVRSCSEGFIERFEKAYLLEVQEFVDCIQESRKPDVVVKDGVMSTIAAYACKESFEKKNLVHLK